MPFKAIKNINPVMTVPVTTTFTITKGVPVYMASGVATICSTNVCNCLGVAHETIASGNNGTLKVLPAQGPNGVTMFESTTTAAVADGGKTYLITLATNTASIGAANTTVGMFFIVTCDTTNATGYFTGNAFQGALSLTA